MCTSATDKRPRGAALVIVMLVMAVLLLAGTTFLTISSTEDQIAHNQQASARAILVAEAGLHRAIAQLSANSTYAGETNVPLGSGTASITVTASSDPVCLSKDLEIVASVPVRGGNAQTRIKATADQAIYPFQWGFFAGPGPLILSSLNPSLGVPRLESYDSRLGIYDASLNGGGSVNVGGQGSVILNNVELIGAAAGDPVTSSPTPVSNLGRPGDTPPSLPEPGATWANDPNVANNAELALPSGTHYYTQMTLGDGARLIAATGDPVTIYIQGNLVAGDGVTIGAEPGQKLSLIMNSGTGAPSEFRTGGNFQFFGSLYGANTKIFLGDNALIHGSMIGRRLSGRDSTWEDGEPCCNQKAPRLRFDRSMTRRAVCTYSTFSIRWGTWREILP